MFITRLEVLVTVFVSAVSGNFAIGLNVCFCDTQAIPCLLLLLVQFIFTLSHPIRVLSFHSAILVVVFRTDHITQKIILNQLNVP